MPEHGELRRFPSGNVAVFNANDGEWQLLPDNLQEQTGEQDIDGRHISEFGRFAEYPAPSAQNQPATGGRFAGPQNAGVVGPQGAGASSQGTPDEGPPPWWDDYRRLTSGLAPSWEEFVGSFQLPERQDVQTGEVVPARFDSKEFNAQFNAAQATAQSAGLIEEEADGDFGSFEEALAAAPPGYEPVYKGGGRWDFQRKEPEQTPTEYATEGEAHEFARSRGLAPGDYSLQWTGTGWGVTVDQVRGQRHTTFDDAQRNAPPGFRPAPRTLSDGSTVWTYEKIPETPEQKFRSFDDLILRKFVDGDIDDAIAADRFRDMITRSSERISPRDFLGLAGQVMGLANDGEEFKEIMGLVMEMTNQPITDPFAAEVQQAANAFDDALRGPATPQQEIDQALQGIRPGGGRQTDALQQAQQTGMFAPPPPLEESEGTGPTRTGDDELVQEALAAARETVEGKHASEVTPEEWARFNATFESTVKTQRALGERQDARARQTSDPFDTPEREPQATRDPFSDLTDRLAETVDSRRKPKRARTTTFV